MSRDVMYLSSYQKQRLAKIAKKNAENQRRRFREEFVAFLSEILDNVDVDDKDTMIWAHDQDTLKDLLRAARTSVERAKQ
jgi:hypothetical protein